MTPLSQPAAPSAYPAPATLDSAQMITLLCATPGAVIHYTRDGSTPDLSSPVFDPYRLIPMVEFRQPTPPSPWRFTIRAIAALGEQVSAESVFTYVLSQRSPDVYLWAEVAPGVKQIRDFDNDKMYLVIGSHRALLIDAGMGSGDLRGLVEQFTGGLPLDVAITHAHPDHVARMGQFQDDCNVFMHLGDMPMLNNFIERAHLEVDPLKIQDLREGHVFDLGDRRLQVYEVPGHSAGSVVLFDEANGILFSGDAIGSNRPTIVDALWMQFGDTRMEDYLSTLQVFRSKIAGKLKMTFGGHNDGALLGEAYLDHLQAAAQKLIDEGLDCLTPGPRPTGVWQAVSGDRLSDPNWAAINVNREKTLPVPPDQIASLSNLQVQGGSLQPGFQPEVLTYTLVAPAQTGLTLAATPSSRRCGGLKINGQPAAPGQALTLPVGAPAVLIAVTSPDGTQTRKYTLNLAAA